MIEIPLSKQGKHKGKYVAIVDDCDSDLALLRWVAHINKSGIYAIRNPGILIHRVILEKSLGRKLKKGEYVDHINHNGLDNRRENLRLANATQNNANKRIAKNNKTGYKGVSWDKARKKYLAYIEINGESIWLGRFETAEVAYLVYCDKAKELFGEYWCDGI